MLHFTSFKIEVTTCSLGCRLLGTQGQFGLVFLFFSGLVEGFRFHFDGREEGFSLHKGDWDCLVGWIDV